MSQQILRILLLTLACAGARGAVAAPFEFASDSAVTRAADLTGRVVETRDGRELGRVHDFAIDLTSGRVAYVVVAIGSFLIEDSLIAVAPDALRASADADGRLILESDPASLRQARRFSAGDWPRRADVLAAPGTEIAERAEAPDGDTQVPAVPDRGTATISDGNKTATLSAGERSIRFVNPPPVTAPDQTPRLVNNGEGVPATLFDRLDRDGDGALNRAEIAHELQRDDRYADIDSDGSGSVDRDEFEALQSRRNGAGED